MSFYVCCIGIVVHCVFGQNILRTSFIPVECSQGPSPQARIDAAFEESAGGSWIFSTSNQEKCTWTPLWTGGPSCEVDFTDQLQSDVIVVTLMETQSQNGKT